MPHGTDAENARSYLREQEATHLSGRRPPGAAAIVSGGTAMTMYRQGDVLLVSTAHSVTGAAVPVPRDHGRFVLAHGEVTGHAHAIRSPQAELFEERGGRLVLRVRAGAERVRLLHEEHDAIVLPPGLYEVIRQREYSPGAIRLVMD